MSLRTSGEFSIFILYQFARSSSDIKSNDKVIVALLNLLSLLKAMLYIATLKNIFFGYLTILYNQDEVVSEAADQSWL